jgi:competence protein ComEC
MAAASRLNAAAGQRREMRTAVAGSVNMGVSLRNGVSLVTVSIAAWAASAPLTAYFFGRFAPGTVIANLAVIPLAFLIVVAACLSMVFGPIFPLMGILFNNANIGLVSVLMAVLSGVTALPGSHFLVDPPPAAWVWMWYAILGILVLAR